MLVRHFKPQRFYKIVPIKIKECSCVLDVFIKHLRSLNTANAVYFLVKYMSVNLLIFFVMTRYIGMIKKIEKGKNPRNKPNKPSAEGERVSKCRRAHQNRKKSCEGLCESPVYDMSSNTYCGGRPVGNLAE